METTVNQNLSHSVEFNELWTLMKENELRMRETDLQMKELRKSKLEMEELRESMKETDRIMRENEIQIKENALQMKETDRQMKETDRKIGELGNRFGELAEHLVAPSIMEKFNALGFHFDRTSNDVKIKKPGSEFAQAEIDILLENYDAVIAVEVKSKPKTKDVEDHVNRMEVLRREADLRNDKRKYQGAVAGAIMDNNIRSVILQNGFYLIEQTGDTVKITIPEGFIPREW